MPLMMATIRKISRCSVVSAFSVDDTRTTDAIAQASPVRITIAVPKREENEVAKGRMMRCRNSLEQTLAFKHFGAQQNEVARLQERGLGSACMQEISESTSKESSPSWTSGVAGTGTDSPVIDASAHDHAC